MEDDTISLNGRLFSNLDNFCHNISIFLTKHYHTLDFLFILLYVVLQLIFVIFIFTLKQYIEFIVSIFIILFLFLISSERIILQFKSKKAQEEKEYSKRQYYDLKEEYNLLKEENKKIIESHEKLIKTILLKQK